MNEFLVSLKADLLDRRMLPILVALGLALAGALAYAALSGGGSSSAPAPIATPVAPLSAAASGSSISVSASTAGTAEPVAETTSGAVHRSAGGARNPFAPLPGEATANAAKSEATTGTSTAAAGSSSPGGPGAGSGTSPTIGTTGGGEPTNSEANTEVKTEAKTAPKKHTKKKTVYRVAVLFGAVPAGSPVPAANLTPYDNLTRQQPLPSVAQPLVVFRGVIAGAKSATFTLVGEAILRGSAACRPSTAQCQAIDLQLGETEELEYVPPGGASVVYQLKLVSITASKASASAARRAFASESRSGSHLLRAVGLSALPGLYYSSATGVLVHAGRWALAARAHALPWGAGLRG